MRTIVVLAQHPEFTESIRTGVNPEQCRVIGHTRLDQAGPLLEYGLAEVCIVDIDARGSWDTDFLGKLCRQARGCPIIVYTDPRSPEWEGKAYVQGVTHVISKPVRRDVLTTLLDRLWKAEDATRAPRSQLSSLPAPSTVLLEIPKAVESMAILRRFSRILTHALNAEAILQEFVLLLREIFNIDRAAIFLRRPTSDLSSSSAWDSDQRLAAAGAIGVSPILLQHIELSAEVGIGGHVFRLGRILRCADTGARNDPAIQREFELLGMQVAVPVTDGDSVLGVAALGGHVTGEPLVNPELELIFHLLQQLGLAIRNTWLHEEIVGNRQMMAEVLSELSNGCVVIRSDLAVLHANKRACRYFRPAAAGDRLLEFSDLPSAIGAKVHQVLKTGAAISSFRFEHNEPAGTVFNLNLVPFQRRQPGRQESVLLIVEDITQIERLRELEIESANLRLVNAMAYRLTNEIGNAILPMVIYEQMQAERPNDLDLRATLDKALSDSIRRVSRLRSQMQFLGLENAGSLESFPVVALIEEAFQEACKHHSVGHVQFKCEAPGAPSVMKGNRKALKQALTEILINALQASPENCKITVTLQESSNGSTSPQFQIEVKDNGGGFTREVAQKATEAFFTTRIVGVGLGLTVSRRIIEAHRGKLELEPTAAGQGGLVRISLPLTPP